MATRLPGMLQRGLASAPPQGLFPKDGQINMPSEKPAIIVLHLKW